MSIFVFFPVIQTNERESAVSLSAPRTKKTNAKERGKQREREDTVSARAGGHEEREREVADAGEEIEPTPTKKYVP